MVLASREIAPSPEITERDVMVQGLNMHVRVGTAGVVDVVLLHGIPGSGRSWDGVIAHLPGSVRAVVPDLIGFGQSSRAVDIETLHAEGQAARLEEALAAVGVERPVLVGHDFGGPVAIRLLMRDPSRYRGVVLAATNTFADTPIPLPLALVNAPLLGPLAERLLFSRAALRAMCRMGARRGRVDADASVGDSEQARAIRTIFAGSLTHLRDLYEPIESTLASIDVPALVLWGDRDPFFPIEQAERTVRAIRGARLGVIEGCGHFLPEETPVAFATMLAEYLSTLGGD